MATHVGGYDFEDDAEYVDVGFVGVEELAPLECADGDCRMWIDSVRVDFCR